MTRCLWSANGPQCPDEVAGTDGMWSCFCPGHLVAFREAILERSLRELSGTRRRQARARSDFDNRALRRQGDAL